MCLMTRCGFSGKSQVMGEIKIALKKEVKTEGEQLVLEILQCRNITYKFKSPDHLPGNLSFLSLMYLTMYINIKDNMTSHCMVPVV